MLEDGVPVVLSEMLRSTDAETYRRAAEAVVELRLDGAPAVLRVASQGYADAEIGELHHDLDGVEQGPSRWGRLVQEWPIRDAD